MAASVVKTGADNKAGFSWRPRPLGSSTHALGRPLHKCTMGRDMSSRAIQWPRRRRRRRRRPPLPLHAEADRANACVRQRLPWRLPPAGGASGPGLCDSNEPRAALTPAIQTRTIQYFETDGANGRPVITEWLYFEL
jgi:hypothetical protein